MKNLDAGTIARTVVLLFSLLNIALTTTGHNPLPFSEDDVYMAVSNVVGVAAVIWSWWCNNNFTKAAQTGEQVIKAIKSGQITSSDVDSVINK